MPKHVVWHIGGKQPHSEYAKEKAHREHQRSQMERAGISLGLHEMCVEPHVSSLPEFDLILFGSASGEYKVWLLFSCIYKSVATF